MPEVADAVVIGAGVQGSSLAFHLAQRGLRVVVLEARSYAAGATGRSSGLVRMHYDVRTDAELAWCSHAYFRAWDAVVGGTCGFVQTGFVQLVPAEETDALLANVDMLRAIGIPTELIDPAQLGDLIPGIITGDVRVAAWEPVSGYADPAATTAAFLSAAKTCGARVVQHAGVTAIRTHAGRVTSVVTPDGEWDAPVVVDAAGAWGAAIARLVGLEVPVRVWRHDVAIVSRPSSLPVHPAVIDFANSCYFRPEGEHLTLIGLEDGNVVGGSPDASTDAAAPGFLQRAAERLSSRIPAFFEAGLHSAHSGQDGITPDLHPIIGPAGPDGFYLDCGFSGTGFKIAPAVGRCMAEMIVDGASQTVDLQPYRLERFAEGDPVVGDHPYAPIWREAPIV